MVSLYSCLRLLVDHMWLGVAAALLFVAGLATAGPVVRYDYRALMVFPLWVVRRVMRIIGSEMRALRVFLVIFLFNSVAIYLYMVSGVLIILPAAFAFLTGLNIGVVVLKGRESALAAAVEAPPDPSVAPPAPVGIPRWVDYCGMVVLALELPSFWISVGLGIGMARKLSVAGQYTLGNMGALLTERTHAYWMIILPALFLSAVAETAAIRGHARGRSEEPQSHEEADD